MIKNKKGQIWVETVVYTLIGISLIGLVLAIITPKINESRDKAVIDQTIDLLNTIDTKISESLDSPGNKRKIEITLKKGELNLISDADAIVYELSDSKAQYSELGRNISIGKINVTTLQNTNNYIIRLRLQYPLNITLEGDEQNKTLTPSSTPYNLFVENKGLVPVDDPINARTNIDITVN